MARRLLMLLLPLLAASAAAAAPAPPVLHHVADVALDTAAHTVTVHDRLTLPPGVAALWFGPHVVVQEVALGGRSLRPTAVADDEGERQVIDLAADGLDQGGEAAIRLTATFHQPTDQVTFSRENVGGEIEATVGDEGIYLSAGAGWLAAAPGALNTYDLTVRVPDGFASVTQGRREVLAPGVTRWVAEHPSDGLNLVANRFTVNEEPVRDGVTAYTFLLEDDADLRATYMERTRAYIAMYEAMFGPYPYAKFATVENWFPTGYGMPSWTLLGGQVLRLPFIPYTSFGHEIAHDWWGNSVFVDASRGNWCEGLTSWSADYHYKELESPEAAREYRRNLLKDYYAYVKDPAADFPLRSFEARHSAATRAVGYGKSMMIFHMLDRQLGREKFLEGLRGIYRDFLFRQAAWDDFLAAFAALGGPDPQAFAAQWLDRAGAPVLALGKVDFGDDAVTFVLQQADPVYDLQVPVRVEGADGPVDQVVHLDGPTATFTVKARAPKRLAVDPDDDVFRRLHPQEVEPTVSQVLAAEVPSVLCGDEALQDAARRFGEGFTDGRFFNFMDDGQPARDLPPGTYPSNIVIDPAPELAARYRVGELTVAGRTVVVGGRRYSLDDYDLVYAAPNPFQPGTSDLVVLCDDAGRLAALGGRLGHYGKYSWLLLPKGQGRVLRGNWTPAASPLVATR